MVDRSAPEPTPFPRGFLSRTDTTDDADFYARPRLVTHIDDRAIEAVGALYQTLEIAGSVLDLMSSWISHFADTPEHLTVLGMNRDELAANPAASAHLVHDLNATPTLPFADHSFDHAVCCVSIDYLIQPLEVFGELARVVRPGGRFVCTFSNRCFPTKAIRGWLTTNDAGRRDIVAEYFRKTPGWSQPEAREILAPGSGGDPLSAVWATAIPANGARSDTGNSHK